MSDNPDATQDTPATTRAIRAERAAKTRADAAAKARRATLRSRIVGSIAAVLLLGILAFLVWASEPLRAEASPFDAVAGNPDLTVTKTRTGVVIAPSETSGIEPTGQGLVFIAGARVEPAAYASKLSGVAEAGYTVVIAQPILGFGIVEYRPLTAFTTLAPGVQSWAVGGHSLGGVRACQYVADMSTAGEPADAATPDALVLFGSYCAVDLSDVDIPVLSLAGENDGLSTADKIADGTNLLPPSTRFVEIAGANHAGFGDYGVQPGDGVATTDDTTIRDSISTEVVALLGGLR